LLDSTDCSIFFNVERNLIEMLDFSRSAEILREYYSFFHTVGYHIKHTSENSSTFCMTDFSFKINYGKKNVPEKILPRTLTAKVATNIFKKIYGIQRVIVFF